MARSIDDIKGDLDVAKRQLASWENRKAELSEELALAILTSNGAEIGSVVDYRGKTFRITSVDATAIGFGEHQWVWGVQRLSSGEFSKSPRRLYGDWTLAKEGA